MSKYCIHIWELDATCKDLSVYKCKECGEVRVVPKDREIKGWEGDFE